MLQVKNGPPGFTFTKYAALAVVFGLSPYVSDLEAQSSRVRKVTRGTNITLSRCPLVPGINEFLITNGGKVVQPAAKFNRKGFQLPIKFKFFSCVKSGGTAVLNAKETRAGGVTQFSFSLTDFPKKSKSAGGSGCSNGTRSIPGGVLYKPSADASDARQGKPVVLLQGGNKNRASAIKIYATNRVEICRFTFKPSSISGVNGGSDHYFSGWSGGCGKTGSQIAAAARSASGNSNILIEWKGGVCLGPVNPTSRVGGIG